MVDFFQIEFVIKNFKQSSILPKEMYHLKLPVFFKQIYNL